MRAPRGLSATRFMCAHTQKQTINKTNKQTNKQTPICLHLGVCRHVGLCVTQIVTLKCGQTSRQDSWLGGVFMPETGIKLFDE